MKNILAAAALFLSTQSYASYVAACEFIGTVSEIVSVPTLDKTVGKYARVAKFTAIAATDRGSHFPSFCASQVGVTRLLLVEAETAISENREIIIDFFHASSPREAGGGGMSETWKIRR